MGDCAQSYILKLEGHPRCAHAYICVCACGVCVLCLYVCVCVYACVVCTRISRTHSTMHNTVRRSSLLSFGFFWHYKIILCTVCWYNINTLQFFMLNYAIEHITFTYYIMQVGNYLHNNKDDNINTIRVPSSRYISPARVSVCKWM